MSPHKLLGLMRNNYLLVPFEPPEGSEYDFLNGTHKKSCLKKNQLLLHVDKRWILKILTLWLSLVPFVKVTLANKKPYWQPEGYDSHRNTFIFKQQTWNLSVNWKEKMRIKNTFTCSMYITNAVHMQSTCIKKKWLRKFDFLILKNSYV